MLLILKIEDRVQVRLSDGNARRVRAILIIQAQLKDQIQQEDGEISLREILE